MKTYQFERTMTPVLNSKVWDCTLDGNVTGSNVETFKSQLLSIAKGWNNELNLKINESAKFDLSAVNALIASFKQAKHAGNRFRIRIDNNQSLSKLLSLTQFDKILPSY